MERTMKNMKLKPIAQALRAAGRDGDTVLAHISPHEAGILKRMGGAGTINPDTGLPEYKIRWGNIFKLAAVVAAVVFAPEILAAVGAEAGVATGAGEVAALEAAEAAAWGAEVASAASTVGASAAEATLAAEVLNGTAEFGGLGLDALTGAGAAAESAATALEVAGTTAGAGAAVPLASDIASAAMQAPLTQTSGLNALTGLDYTATMAAGTPAVQAASASVPWWQTMLDTVKANPLPSAIVAQGILGGVGAVGAAQAREEEVRLAAQMPEIQRQAAENAMAGAGQITRPQPPGSLMPPEWGAPSVVPRDPATGLPLGIVYPQPGLINTATRRT